MYQRQYMPLKIDLLTKIKQQGNYALSEDNVAMFGNAISSASSSIGQMIEKMKNEKSKT